MAETKKLILLKALDYIRMNAEEISFEHLHTIADRILEDLEDD